MRRDIPFRESSVPAAILERARADAVRVVLSVGELPGSVKGLVVVLRC